MKFPIYQQHDAMDCEPICLRMIAAFYGRIYSLENLREKSMITREGTSLLGISEAAENIGFRTTGVKVSFDDLMVASIPCIVHWNQYHFVVVYDIKTKKGKETVYIADPAAGKFKFTREEFCSCWISTKDKGIDVGVALLLEPSPGFYEQEDEKVNRKGFSFLFSYLKPYKNLVLQLFMGLIFGSLLQLILPFLTQSIVDYGISGQNIGFIYLVLIAQLVLTISSSAVGFIRGWILLHLGTRINIALISDFLIKMMRLPMGYFDTKMVGDILQRINDHRSLKLHRNIQMCGTLHGKIKRAGDQRNITMGNNTVLRNAKKIFHVVFQKIRAREFAVISQCDCLQVKQKVLQINL